MFIYVKKLYNNNICQISVPSQHVVTGEGRWGDLQNHRSATAPNPMYKMHSCQPSLQIAFFNNQT